MKKSANILIVAFAFLVLQACGSKSTESESKESESTESKPEVAATPVAEVKVLTIEQKREKIEKERIARAARLQHDREELAKNTPSYTDSKGKVIYYKAELEPMYTGGPKALSKYLNENLKFPDAARQNEAEGTVFVDFVVEKNGTVSEVEVTDAYNADVDQSFRDEAFRVVSAMPRWTPGSQRGKKVDVKYSLPITFTLN